MKRVPGYYESLIRHSLGLNRGDTAYRNHFVASENHNDYPALMKLVEQGHMTRRPDPFDHTGEQIVFHVTEAGKQTVMTEQEAAE